MSKFEEKSIKIQPKIDQKSISTWEGILTSIFAQIFFDFGGQNGTKLGGKIDQKSTQKSLQKQERKNTVQDAKKTILEPSWARLRRLRLSAAPNTRGGRLPLKLCYSSSLPPEDRRNRRSIEVH